MPRGALVEGHNGTRRGSPELCNPRGLVRSSRSMRAQVAGSGLALVLSIFGCANAKNNADAWTDEPVRETRPFRDVEVLGQGTSVKNDRPMSAWLGVRHDVTLANGQRTERCACVAAEVGGAA